MLYKKRHMTHLLSYGGGGGQRNITDGARVLLRYKTPLKQDKNNLRTMRYTLYLKPSQHNFHFFFSRHHRRATRHNVATEASHFTAGTVAVTSQGRGHKSSRTCVTRSRLMS